MIINCRIEAAFFIIIVALIIQSRSTKSPNQGQDNCTEKNGDEYHLENLLQIYNIVKNNDNNNNNSNNNNIQNSNSSDDDDNTNSDQNNNDNDNKDRNKDCIKASRDLISIYSNRCDEKYFDHFTFLQPKTLYLMCRRFYSKIDVDTPVSNCTLTVSMMPDPQSCLRDCPSTRHWMIRSNSLALSFSCICMSCGNDYHPVGLQGKSRSVRSLHEVKNNITSTNHPNTSTKQLNSITPLPVRTTSTSTHSVPVTLDFSCTLGNCTTKNTTRGLGEQLTYVKIMTPLSVLALLLNCLLMAKLCLHKKYVLVDIFATNLTLFNIVLSLYGIGMTFFIVLPHMFEVTQYQQNKYCQGFTSMKLFSLGSIVYSLILLTLHHKIHDAASDARDAIFRGIVWILEATLFSGLFSVTCYIKLDHWDDLCGIITPHTTVENMFIAYESFYYLVTTALVVYNVYMLCRKRRVNIRRNRARRRKCKNDIDIDIFAMTLLSLLVWVPAYIVTYPFSGIEFYNATVIRVCALMIPCIIQPCIYISNNHPFFKKRRAKEIGSRRRVNNTVGKDDEMLVEKDETAN